MIYNLWGRVFRRHFSGIMQAMLKPEDTMLPRPSSTRDSTATTDSLGLLKAEPHMLKGSYGTENKT